MKNPDPLMNDLRHDGWTRRGFLRRGLLAGAALGWMSGLDDRVWALDAPLGDEAPFSGGRKLGLLPFQPEPDLPFGVPVASGLDARLYVDLSRLEPGRLITPVEEFYVRTGIPDRLTATTDWRLQLGGKIEQPMALRLADLEAEVRDFGVHLLECAGNASPAKFGLISAGRWSGIPLAAVLDRARRTSGATAVRISGFDGHSRPSSSSSIGCSWVFTFDQLESSGAFLATHLNDQRLTPVHGYPVRLMVPGWYGCCAVKWVERIDFVTSGVAATAQMREFAARTHQDGVPEKALDYLPATIDPAAMPIRVEVWQVGERRRYRVVGLLWGGQVGKSQLQIRFRPSDPYSQVSSQPSRDDTRTWTLWSHVWDPPPGRYLIQLRLDDPSLQTRRLDMGLYLRGVEIPAA